MFEAILWALLLFPLYLTSAIKYPFTIPKVLLLFLSFGVLTAVISPILKEVYEQDPLDGGYDAARIGNILLLGSGIGVLAFAYTDTHSFSLGPFLILYSFVWLICLPYFYFCRQPLQRAFSDLQEKSLMSLMYLRCFFKRESPEEAILKRKDWEMEKSKIKSERNKSREYQKQIKDKDEKIKQDQKKLARIHKSYPEVTQEIPDIIEYLSEDFKYRGYWGEVERRFQEGQIGKSVAKRTQIVAEVKYLIQEITELRRAKTDLTEAFYESEVTERGLQVKRKRMEQRQIEERVDLEMDITKLELEKDKLKIEAEKVELQEKIDNIKETKQARKEEKEAEVTQLSSQEGLLQRVENQIKMLKAKGEGAKKIAQAREETLKSIDSEKNSELYKRINNMYNNLLMEVMK